MAQSQPPQDTEESMPFLQRGGARAPHPEEWLSRRNIMVALSVIAGVLFIGMVLKLQANQRKREALRPAPLPPAYEVRGKPRETSELLGSSSFAGVDRRPKVLQVPVAEALPVSTPLPPAPPVQLAAPPPPPSSPPAQPAVVQPAAQPVMVPVAPTPPGRRPAKSPATVAPVKADTGKLTDKWAFVGAKDDDLLKPPKTSDLQMKTEAGPPGKDGKENKDGEGLLPKARWAIPEHKERVIYASQVINGALLQDVNSDHPGTIRILVTEDIRGDRGNGDVLIPQYSVMLAQPDGKIKYGDKTMGAAIDTVELLHGEIIDLRKATVGDAQGASGIPGKVDNHWVALGASAVITAVGSVGTRAIAGSPTGYQENLAQSFAGDASKSFNQSGQQIIKRELERPPTFFGKHGEAVTIQLKEPINLQSRPTLVRK